MATLLPPSSSYVLAVDYYCLWVLLAASSTTFKTAGIDT